MITRRGLGLGFGALAAFAPFAARAQDVEEPEWPNVFISPTGQPFRAPETAPYPVVNWFKQADKNGDGHIDHAEFMADAEAFFKTLDLNGDGILDNYEIAVYERRVAPEILGLVVPVAKLDRGTGEGRSQLWLAQVGGMPGMQSPQPGETSSTPPLDSRKELDESQQGASPFSFFDQPEPVTAADFNFDGLIRKGNYMKLAETHFTRLDVAGQGYLTLAGLPQTRAQRLHDRRRHKLL